MCIGNEWVKWAQISLFKLSLLSDFKPLWQSTSDWPDPYISKPDVEKLQSELLPANCHLKIFEIYCRKLVLRIWLLFYLNEAYLYLDDFFYLFTMIDKKNVLFFTSLHISVKCVLTSYPFLFQSVLSVRSQYNSQNCNMTFFTF